MAIRPFWLNIVVFSGRSDDGGDRPSSQRDGKTGEFLLEKDSDNEGRDDWHFSGVGLHI